MGMFRPTEKKPQTHQSYSDLRVVDPRISWKLPQLKLIRISAKKTREEKPYVTCRWNESRYWYYQCLKTNRTSDGLNVFFRCGSPCCFGILRFYYRSLLDNRRENSLRSLYAKKIVVLLVKETIIRYLVFKDEAEIEKLRWPWFQFHYRLSIMKLQTWQVFKNLEVC